MSAHLAASVENSPGEVLGQRAEARREHDPIGRRVHVRNLLPARTVHAHRHVDESIALPYQDPGHDRVGQTEYRTLRRRSR